MAMLLDERVPVKTSGALPLPDFGAPDRCRTNSRRGLTDETQRSYPPVEAVHRAFDVLRAVNRLRIASVNGIYEETGMPKSTIVRMLETLMAEGYVARDNMCGGYRVTGQVNELTSGYDGISQIIEVARPYAIELTLRIKWPIALATIEPEGVVIDFWTGTISPWTHTNTVLGIKPELRKSAMGRAALAFMAPEDLERHIEHFRADTAEEFTPADEKRLRQLLTQVRDEGYAARDPRTKPYRTTTFAVPIREEGVARAVMSISCFKTALPTGEVAEKIVEPLREAALKVEAALAVINAGHGTYHHGPAEKVELAF